MAADGDVPDVNCFATAGAPAHEPNAQSVPSSPPPVLDDQAGQNIAMGQPVAKFIASCTGALIEMTCSIAEVIPGDDSVSRINHHADPVTDPISDDFFRWHIDDPFNELRWHPPPLFQPVIQLLTWTVLRCAPHPSALRTAHR